MHFEVLTDIHNGTRDCDWYVWDSAHQIVTFRGTVYQCCMWVAVEGPLWRVRQPLRNPLSSPEVHQRHDNSYGSADSQHP